MKCTLVDCPGEYEERFIVHVVRHKNEVIVLDRVPAEVCSVCGDVLLRPETVQQIERMLRALPEPTRTVPVYEFAYA